MRRRGDLWDQVASFGSLRVAALRAARGKRHSAASARFLDRLEPECLRLEEALLSGRWRPSPASSFHIRDPKPRTITAVPFVDRVVHHALIGALEPVFERRMIEHSYACRRGKGVHAALTRMRQLARSHGFALRMDVASFFPSLRHDVVWNSVARCVKDPHVLALVRTVLDGPPGTPHAGRGLPIGSLTSQWFANLVLDRLDHFASETLRLRGWIRYMDDFGCVGASPTALHAARVAITGFLREELQLEPKERASIVAPFASGVPWLGFLVFPGTVRLRPQNARRYAWRLRELRWRLRRGSLTEARYRAAVAAVLAHVSWADSRMLRRSWCRSSRLLLREG